MDKGSAIKIVERYVEMINQKYPVAYEILKTGIEIKDFAA